MFNIINIEKIILFNIKMLQLKTIENDFKLFNETLNSDINILTNVIQKKITQMQNNIDLLIKKSHLYNVKTIILLIADNNKNKK